MVPLLSALDFLGLSTPVDTGLLKDFWERVFFIWGSGVSRRDSTVVKEVENGLVDGGPDDGVGVVVELHDGRVDGEVGAFLELGLPCCRRSGRGTSGSGA